MCSSDLPPRARDRSAHARGAPRQARRRDRAWLRATIARPYSRAAFEAARDAKNFAAWSAALARLAAVVADERVGALITNPAVSRGELAEFIAGVAGGALAPDARNFVSILAENHRLALLPEIASQYEALRADAENTVDVEVTSAVPLDEIGRASCRERV